MSLLWTQFDCISEITLKIIMDNCLLAIADDLVEKYSSPISDPNMFKMSKFGAYEFNFVLQASHAVVLSKWRRNAWQTPETSAWETNLVLINWISYYIFKGLFLQHSVQQTTLTNHDPHGNQHWRICRRILVYTFCLINIGLSLSDEHESRGGSSDFRLPTSDFRLQTSDFGLKTSFFKLQTSDLTSSNSGFLISDRWDSMLHG